MNAKPVIPLRNGPRPPRKRWLHPWYRPEHTSGWARLWPVHPAAPDVSAGAYAGSIRYRGNWPRGGIVAGAGSLITAPKRTESGKFLILSSVVAHVGPAVWRRIAVRGCTANRDFGQKRASWATQLWNQRHFEEHGPGCCEHFEIGPVPAKTSPSTQNPATPQDVRDPRVRAGALQSYGPIFKATSATFWSPQ